MGTRQQVDFSHPPKNHGYGGSGSGGFMGMRRVPGIFLYSVEDQTFSQLDTKGFAPGHLQWHPKVNALVGVAWRGDKRMPKEFHKRTDQVIQGR